MPTLSVQQMPNGFEVETPTVYYWMKAGAAFTFGAGCVTVAAGMLWLLLLSKVPELIFLRALSRL